MKRRILIVVIALSACGKDAPEDATGSDDAKPVQTADLTGLYEAAGAGDQRPRMCMIGDQSGATSFGIVTGTTDGGSCAGAGEAVRQSNTLRLTMAGDEACTIEARITGTQVRLPAAVPQGCAYYCAPDATLAGAIFEKTGGTAEDAMRALDLAGDPLCG